MSSFSPEETAQFQRIYNLSDVNCDGVLKKEEAINALKGLGYNQHALRWALSTADNGDGVITFDEFLSALSQLKKSHGFSAKEVGLFRQVFNTADKNGSGNLDSDELVSALGNLGYHRDSAISALELADTNKDGTIDFDEFLEALWKVKPVGHGFSPDKVSDFRRLFNKWDVSKDGRLDPNEVAEGLKHFGFHKGQIQTLLQQADKNKDGVIDFDEFLNAMWQMKQARSHGFSQQDVEYYKSVFDSCDTNRNGELDKNEASAALTKLGFNLHAVNAVFDKFDSNGDGVVDFTEFLKALWKLRGKNNVGHPIKKKLQQFRRRQHHGIDQHRGIHHHHKLSPHHPFPWLVIVVKPFAQPGFLSAL